MSLSLLNRVGVETSFLKNKISIKSFSSKKKSIQNVESDWSSLSYFYSITALSSKSNLEIGTYFYDSIQGDKKIIDIWGIKNK